MQQSTIMQHRHVYTFTHTHTQACMHTHKTVRSTCNVVVMGSLNLNIYETRGTCMHASDMCMCTCIISYKTFDAFTKCSEWCSCRSIYYTNDLRLIFLIRAHTQCVAYIRRTARTRTHLVKQCSTLCRKE